MLIPQRFAIDWAKIGPNGNVYRGDPSKNVNYFGYGAEVLAVGDAVVVGVKDGMPENIPSEKERAIPISLFNAGGNSIMLDLGNSRFAFYAHLQPQSLRVKVGDKVRRGQVLALLGNSGNATGPHLHFHVVDANMPLFAEGMPYVFESFEVAAKRSRQAHKRNGREPKSRTYTEVRHMEMPIGGAVVNFP